MTFPSNRRRGIGIAAAAFVVAAGVSVEAGPAYAGPTSSLESGAHYVALGSSYAAGASIGTKVADDPWCGRTLDAYPTLVADALDLDLINGSCGGAKIDNITAVPQRVTTQTGATFVAPLQIDSVTAETDLVTITIGGNDVNYTGNLNAEACLGDLAANPSSPISNGLKAYGICTPWSDERVLTELAGVEAELVDAVEAIKAKAPGAVVVLVDYPTVLPQNGKSCDAAPIAKDRQKFLIEIGRKLSLATKHAAQQTGSEFVAASKESHNHDVCSSDPWMIGYDFSRTFSTMHPNEAGQAATAAAVVRRLSGATSHR
jgi:lysophospholipase L1-like esterase